jgi:hypothetical protein
MFVGKLKRKRDKERETDLGVNWRTRILSLDCILNCHRMVSNGGLFGKSNKSLNVHNLESCKHLMEILYLP